MDQDSVPLDNCDVSDKEKLAVYRYFRRRWIDMLNGEDEHAIVKQLTLLFDADLKFRAINAARGLCDKAGSKQNGMVHQFIDRGFLAHQVLTIRRLTEQFDGQKRKAVYSLPRIIDEMEDQRELITRELYVCVAGEPYDPDARFRHSFFLHRNFDEFSQVEEAQRRRDDVIHPDVFKELRHRLDSSKEIRTYANKKLAHAADPLTRKEEVGLTLKHFDHAYKDLSWITNRLSANLLYSSSNVFVPHYAYDVLKHIENGLCPAEKLDDLQKMMVDRREELKDFGREASPEV